MAYGELGRLIPQSTNLIELRELRYADVRGDEDDPPYLDATAEVELIIINARGQPVAGESWPKTMSIVAGTESGPKGPVWRGLVSDQAAIFHDQNYLVEVIARGPEGSKRVFSSIFPALRSGR